MANVAVGRFSNVSPGSSGAGRLGVPEEKALKKANTVKKRKTIKHSKKDIDQEDYQKIIAKSAKKVSGGNKKNSSLYIEDRKGDKVRATQLKNQMAYLQSSYVIEGPVKRTSGKNSSELLVGSQQAREHKPRH